MLMDENKLSSPFYARTEMLLGKEGVKRLVGARVAIFGIGGVGGHTVEALCRAGVESFLLIDGDRVSESNLNRQIIATKDTVGMYKTEAARARILSINPSASVQVSNIFFTPEDEVKIDLSGFDYVVDAIDSVAAKVTLISMAKAASVPIISAMGAGNKLDPTAFRVADISKTEICPLARAVRTALRKRGITHTKVVYSTELPENTDTTSEQKADGKRAPASVSFVPSVMGLIIAGEVIKDIAGKNSKTSV